MNTTSIWAETRTALLVALGAGIGTVARYGCTDIASYPLIVVNAVGCFLIALVPTGWKPFVATGFLGGFTSFSTFMLATESLVSGALSVLGCLSAWFVGDCIKNRVKA